MRPNHEFKDVPSHFSSWNLPPQTKRLTEAWTAPIYDTEKVRQKLGSLPMYIYTHRWVELAPLACTEYVHRWTEPRLMLPIAVSRHSRLTEEHNIEAGTLWDLLGYLAEKGPIPETIYVDAQIQIEHRLYYPCWMRSLAFNEQWSLNFIPVGLRIKLPAGLNRRVFGLGVQLDTSTPAFRGAP